MLFSHYHDIDGKITASTQSSTPFSGKERGKIYSVCRIQCVEYKALNNINIIKCMEYNE